MTALWTEACLTFPALDALAEGYEVYVVVDAVGGTSVAAHEAALRRIEQAGGQMISVPQLFCELQRDWARKETVPAFMDLFIETAVLPASSSLTTSQRDPRRAPWPGRLFYPGQGRIRFSHRGTP